MSQALCISLYATGIIYLLLCVSPLDYELLEAGTVSLLSVSPMSNQVLSI